MPIRVPMHLLRRPDSSSDLVADQLGAPWRWEGQGLPLEVRAAVLEHLARLVQLPVGEADGELDGGSLVTLDPRKSEAALCSALLGLGGACSVVVVWGKVVGLPVQAAA